MFALMSTVSYVAFTVCERLAVALTLGYATIFP